MAAAQIHLDNDFLSAFTVPTINVCDSALCEIIPAIGRHLPTSNSNLERGLKVNESTNSRHVRRWDKKNYCLFCCKPYAKLPKHFLHSSDKEVTEFSSLKKKSAERNALIQKLTNIGNFKHNCDILKSGSGELIPSRRPIANENRNPQDYLPCQYCLGLYINRNLWKHERKCKFKKTSNSKSRNNNIQSRSALMLPSDFEHNEKLTEILQNMNNDEISICVRNDPLILKYGVKLLKVGKEQHNRHHISQKMRELARLVMEIRKANPQIKCLKTLKLVVDGVKSVCGYGTPSLALKLGSSLKKCCAVFKAEAIVAQDDPQKSAVGCFLELCELEWNDQVSSEALKTLNEKKWNKPQLLPLVDDIVTLQKYLNNKQDALMNQLQNTKTTNAWYELSKVILAKLILFNRRRCGEASRILVESYNISDNTNYDNDDVLNCLSKFEKELCKKLHRFETKGKRGRKVPVLLTMDIKAGIDLLMEFRKHVEVLDENMYLFAVPNSVYPLRGSDCLRRFGKECGCKKPENITSTKLRKHIATFSQIISLKDNELDILAKYMGHDIRVHREYYRLPENTLQMAKISKILLAMEGGSISKLADVNLDDIEVDINTTVEEDSDGTEDDEAQDEVEDNNIFDTVKEQNTYTDRIQTKQDNLEKSMNFLENAIKNDQSIKQSNEQVSMAARDFVVPTMASVVKASLTKIQIHAQPKAKKPNLAEQSMATETSSDNSDSELTAESIVQASMEKRTK